jgi:hypothetical protein
MEHENFKAIEAVVAEHNLDIVDKHEVNIRGNEGKCWNQFTARRRLNASPR